MFHYARHGKPWLPYSTDFHKNSSLFLGPEGIQQATALGKRLFDDVITHIIASYYRRAIQTGAAAGRVLNVSRFQQTELLNEVHHGNLSPEDFKYWLKTGLHNSSQVDPEAETISQVRHRLRLFLSEFKPDEQTLVVGHKLLFSVLLLEAANLPDETPVVANPNNKELYYAENTIVNIEF
jgi:broad specificity phosphatase PhoE